MDAVEQIWTEARNRNGEFRDRRRPSAGIAAVLMTLLRHGTLYGHELARRSGQDQGNLAGPWLPKLERFGFVTTAYEEPGIGHQGGGRPAIGWRLTRAGRALAELLASERVEAAA